MIGVANARIIPRFFVPSSERRGREDEGSFQRLVFTSADISTGPESMILPKTQKD